MVLRLHGRRKAIRGFAAFVEEFELRIAGSIDTDANSRLTFGIGELREQDGLLPGSVVSGFAFGLERCQLIAAVVVMPDVNPYPAPGISRDFRMVSTCTTEPVT